MKNRNCTKSLFVILIISIILIFEGNAVFAEESDKGDYSKKYEEWLELPEEERENVLPPFSVNVRAKKKSKIEEMASLFSAIPAKFDLRTDAKGGEGIDIEVKNQMDTGECWTFSANSVLETNLALNDEEYNFSERHMDYYTANIYDNRQLPGTLKRNLEQGGTFSTAYTYYSNGSGPILEEDMPFENNELPINFYELPLNLEVKKVDNMVYFPSIYKRKENGKLIYEDGDGGQYTPEEVKQIRNDIKEHIMNNGGITVGVLSPSYAQAGYNESKKSANCNDSTARANHAVTIIGWDDGYEIEKFNNRPSEKGAYIVLNSWGNKFGENGIYYVSYEDFLIETTMNGVIGVSDIAYDNLYQYDYSEMWNYKEGKYAANVFTSQNNEKLTEVMIGSWSDQKCNVYYSASDNLNKKNLTKIASNVTLRPGYNTVVIRNNIRITKGSKFAIVVEMIGNDYTGVGIENNTKVPFGNAKSNPGESFVSENGLNWTDIYDSNDPMNFSIKAYTQTETKILDVADIYGNGFENIGGYFTYTVENSYIEQGKKLNISIFNQKNEDVTNRFTIKGDTIRRRGTFIEIECPNNIEKGTYCVETSLPNYEKTRKSFTVQEKSQNIITAQFKDQEFFNYMKSQMKNSIPNNEKMTISADKREFEKITDITLWDTYAKDITGIENYTNLKILKLTGTSEVVSLKPISNLIKLEQLFCNSAATRDFEAITNLNNLEWLEIFNSHYINDLEFLKNKNKIEILRLVSACPEKKIDISSIFKLNNLRDLNLSGWNWITENDMHGIDNLKNLKCLDLVACNIGDLKFIKGLNLEQLFLSNTYVIYGSIGGSTTGIGKGTNHVSDLSPISNMTSLRRLHISDIDTITNLNAISNLQELEELYVSRGKLEDASALDNGEFEKLRQFGLNENTIRANIEINSNQETILQLPKLIQQACDKNSKVYSPNGVKLKDCEWNEYGKSIKIDPSKLNPNASNYAYVQVNSGVAQNSMYYANLTIKKEPKDINDLAITLSQTEFTYDGTPKEPEIILYKESKKLVKGKDYTVTYSNNINAGSGKMVVTGIGNYKDTRKFSFTINKRPLVVTTNSKTVKKGKTVGTLTYKLTGNIKGETPKVTLTTNAKSTSKVGRYAITSKISNNGKFKTSNYTVKFVKGYVTITK